MTISYCIHNLFIKEWVYRLQTMQKTLPQQNTPMRRDCLMYNTFPHYSLKD